MTKKGNGGSSLDRIKMQIQWNRLLSVVEEQAQTLLRTAFSTTVREAGDLSAGVFDIQGQMLAQAVTGTPGHVNTMAAAIQNFIEDIGRHNATDAIAGEMWLEDIKGDDKWFYTTGRLTSEIVMKVASMGIPVLLSRSGITQMGFELAEHFGVTLIARAKGHHFLVYSGKDNLIYDQIPKHRRDTDTINS